LAVFMNLLAVFMNLLAVFVSRAGEKLHRLA